MFPRLAHIRDKLLPISQIQNPHPFPNVTELRLSSLVRLAVLGFFLRVGFLKRFFILTPKRPLQLPVDMHHHLLNACESHCDIKLGALLHWEMSHGTSV